MTQAKEKAISLIQTFIDEGFLPAAARIAALIAVDEIIGYSRMHGFIGLTEYWQQVKNEIEKL